MMNDASGPSLSASSKQKRADEPDQRITGGALKGGDYRESPLAQIAASKEAL